MFATVGPTPKFHAGVASALLDDNSCCRTPGSVLGCSDFVINYWSGFYQCTDRFSATISASDLIHRYLHSPLGLHSRSPT